MHRTLSMPFLLVLPLAACAAAPRAQAQIGVTAIRQPGSSLDPSIRNEAEHAVDLAAAWLAARQDADGSWGPESNRVARTSVALLALTARAARHSDACARAAVWLDSHPPAPHALSDAHAWRLIALLSVAPDAPGRAGLTRRLLEEARPHAPGADDGLVARLLWRDALALAGHAPLPPPEDGAQTLALAARDWPPAPSAQPPSLWRSAYLINRLADGALRRGGEPLDWRRDVAQILINAQRRDPSAGAYWDDPARADRAWQTAFGLLALQEL